MQRIFCTRCLLDSWKDLATHLQKIWMFTHLAEGRKNRFSQESISPEKYEVIRQMWVQDGETNWQIKAWNSEVYGQAQKYFQCSSGRDRGWELQLWCSSWVRGNEPLVRPHSPSHCFFPAVRSKIAKLHCIGGWRQPNHSEDLPCRCKRLHSQTLATKQLENGP